jgi:hypothetical protein
MLGAPNLNKIGTIASSRSRRVRAAFAVCSGTGAVVGLLRKVVVVMTPSISRPRCVTTNGSRLAPDSASGVRFRELFPQFVDERSTEVDERSSEAVRPSRTLVRLAK